MRIIGLDIHRAFAEAVAWENGKLKRLGRIDMRRDRLAAFAATLSANDIVIVEATGNAAAVADVIAPHVKRVAIANPKQVRVIAHAKIKTDTIDAGVLAQLYASGFLPEVWIANEATQAQRRQVTRRNQIVRQRTRLKNIMQSIVHAHLIPACPHQDLCGPKGRAWLGEQVLPADERLAMQRHLREFDRLGEISRGGCCARPCRGSDAAGGANSSCRTPTLVCRPRCPAMTNSRRNPVAHVVISPRASPHGRRIRSASRRAACRQNSPRHVS